MALIFFVIGTRRCVFQRSFEAIVVKIGLGPLRNSTLVEVSSEYHRNDLLHLKRVQEEDLQSRALSISGLALAVATVNTMGRVQNSHNSRIMHPRTILYNSLD